MKKFSFQVRNDQLDSRNGAIDCAKRCASVSVQLMEVGNVWR